MLLLSSLIEFSRPRITVVAPNPSRARLFVRARESYKIVQKRIFANGSTMESHERSVGVSPVARRIWGPASLVSVWTLAPLKPLLQWQFRMEAEVGIEPTNEAFAEPCLTTWLLRRSDQNSQLYPSGKNGFLRKRKSITSGRVKILNHFSDSKFISNFNA